MHQADLGSALKYLYLLGGEHTCQWLCLTAAPGVWEVHPLLPGLVQEQQQGGEALGQDCVQRCQVCHKQECELADKGNWALTMGLQQVEDAGQVKKSYCPSKWWVEVWASAQTIGGKEEVHRSSSAWQDDRISLHYLGRMQFPTDDSHYSLSFGGGQAPPLSWTFATKGEIDILILVHELLI